MDIVLVVVVVALVFMLLSLVVRSLGEESLVMGALMSREERIEDMFVVFELGLGGGREGEERLA